jgi:hypothetical protein
LKREQPDLNRVSKAKIQEVPKDYPKEYPKEAKKEAGIVVELWVLL